MGKSFFKSYEMHAAPYAATSEPGKFYCPEFDFSFFLTILIKPVLCCFYMPFQRLTVGTGLLVKSVLNISKEFLRRCDREMTVLLRERFHFFKHRAERVIGFDEPGACSNIPESVTRSNFFIVFKIGKIVATEFLRRGI